MNDQKIKGKNRGWSTLILIIFVAITVLYFYLDRQNQLSQVIWTWGPGGVLLSIFLMTALCMTPIPSEGLLLLIFKIFGIYEGILYSWLGFILGSLVIFYLARYLGQSILQKMITPHRFGMVNNWIREKGPLGLLIAGLSPIPPFTISYIAGVMPSVKLWTFVWTGAISIIPYYIGAALIYVGVAQSTWIWLAVGGVVILILGVISYILSKEAKNSLK